MNDARIAQELVSVARELSASPVQYDAGTEEKFNKQYQNMLGQLMKKPHLSYLIQAAKAVYDRVEFVNEEGVSFKIVVNSNAKKESDILKVTASRDGKKQVKTIAPNMVPWMVG